MGVTLWQEGFLYIQFKKLFLLLPHPFFSGDFVETRVLDGEFEGEKRIER